MTTERKEATLQFEREVDGRWIGEILEVPGALVYGQTLEEAAKKAYKMAQELGYE